MIATPFGKAILLGGAGCVPFSRIDGSVAANTSFIHPANGVIAWTQTTLPSPGAISVNFRQQDASNYWNLNITSGGNLILWEVVAGGFTQRALASSIVSNGHRIVIAANGTTIQGYSNGVLRWTYSSASNFATATAGKAVDLGTGGVVRDLKTWQLACRAMEGV